VIDITSDRFPTSASRKKYFEMRADGLAIMPIGCTMYRMAQTKLLTTGQIAERFGIREHRVLYAIRTRKIKAVGRAGLYRLYDIKGVLAIGRALAESKA